MIIKLLANNTLDIKTIAEIAEISIAKVKAIQAEHKAKNDN